MKVLTYSANVILLHVSCGNNLHNMYHTYLSCFSSLVYMKE